MPAPEGPDLREVGRLIQFALQPEARPAGDSDYGRLMDRFVDDTGFRAAVREVADGLGLVILEYGEHGILLAPQAESAFAMRTSDYRITAGTAVEDRLLDGLVQLGIAATLYPRAEDLDDDAARPPLSVDDVEETLRQLCERLAAESVGQDPPVGADGTALDEAWRIYNDRQSARETRDGRRGARTTRGIIERGLEFLRGQGCFVRLPGAGPVRYRSTWRYESMVREMAATALFERVQTALGTSLEDAPDA